MALALSNYKGVLVATAMLAGGTALWFERSDAHVKIVDAGEVAAGVLNCRRMLDGAGQTNAYWYVRGWEEDINTTLNWGGYSQITFTVVDGSECPSGTFVFNTRVYGEFNWGFGSKITGGGAIDIYINSSASYPSPDILIDCGPSGAFYSYPDAYPKSAMGWVVGWNSVFVSGVSSFTPAFNDISNGISYSMWNIAGAVDIFSDSKNRYKTNSSEGADLNHFTISTTGSDPKRVREYHPHKLVAYTNAISTTFEQVVIKGVRDSIAACIAPLPTSFDPGHIYHTYFIDPTNTEATYDGVSDFPVASTSLWAAIYNKWANGSTTNIVVTYFTNDVPALDSNVVSYVNQNQGIFITTNELSWEYSVLYRLRDQHVPNWNGYSSANSFAYTNYNYFKISTGSSFSVAYSTAAADFSAHPTGNGLSGYPWVPHCAVYRQDSVPGGTFVVEVDMASTGYTDSNALSFTYNEVPQFTGVVHSVEFYATVNPTTFTFTGTGSGGTHFYDPCGQTVISTNTWKLWDTEGPDTGQMNSTMYGTWVFPSSSSFINTNTCGWKVSGSEEGPHRLFQRLEGIRRVIRWQQPACTKPVFDGRYP